jgi:hypothetical protein
MEEREDWCKRKRNWKKKKKVTLHPLKAHRVYINGLATIFFGGCGDNGNQGI